MKKTLLFAIVVFISHCCLAQNSPLNQSVSGCAAGDAFTYVGKTVSHYGLGWYQEPNEGFPPTAYLSGYYGIKLFTTGQPRFFINNIGNVGVGTVNPNLGKLHIEGTGDLLSLSASGTEAQLNAYNNVDFRIVQRSAAPLTLWTSTIERFRIDAAGNVAIGTTDSHGYKLAVNGNIRAKEIKVEAGPWPDFVFNPTYKLLSLEVVKAYIDKNRHLPDMPSEEEVAKNGVNLGEIVKLQTKKIEELTLYLMQQQARIVKLEKVLSSKYNKKGK